MTKNELMEKLVGYADDEHLAFVWFDKEEIAVTLSDTEWENRCDDLILSNSIKDVAEHLMTY